MKKFLKDFKEFAVKGNVIDLAVGVMIAGAFGKIVASLVSDLFMPLIGLLTGGIDLTGLFWKVGNAQVNYGLFLTNVIDFVLIALCVFLFVQLVSKLMPKKEAKAPEKPTRDCPYCLTTIDARATRCPNCTAQVEPTALPGAEKA